jgi:hypothetical protein
VYLVPGREVMKLGEFLQEKGSSVKVIPWRKGMGVGEY